MYLDDYRTLTDEEADILTRMMAGGFLALNVVAPGSGKTVGTGTKFGIKFLARGITHAETWISTAVRGAKLDDAIKLMLGSKKGMASLGRTLDDARKTAGALGSETARLLRTDHKMPDEAIVAVSKWLPKGGYKLSDFKVAMDDIKKAYDNSRLDKGQYDTLMGRVRSMVVKETARNNIDIANVGELSNVLEAGAAARKGYPIGVEVAVSGGKSVDLVIFSKTSSTTVTQTVKRDLKDALVVREIKQVENPLNENRFKSRIDEAIPQMRAVGNVGEDTRRQILIDARFTDDVGASTKDTLRKFLDDDYWRNINEISGDGVIVDDIIIRTRGEPIVFTRKGLDPPHVIH